LVYINKPNIYYCSKSYFLIYQLSVSHEIFLAVRDQNKCLYNFARILRIRLFHTWYRDYETTWIFCPVSILYYELFPIFHYTGFVYSHVVFTDSFFKKKQIFWSLIFSHTHEHQNRVNKHEITNVFWTNLSRYFSRR